MSDDPPGTQSGQGSTEAERRRRRAEVFGEVLPETSTDERGETWNEADPGGSGPDRSDEWLRRQVPPHHT